MHSKEEGTDEDDDCCNKEREGDRYLADGCDDRLLTGNDFALARGGIQGEVSLTLKASQITASGAVCQRIAVSGKTVGAFKRGGNRALSHANIPVKVIAGFAGGTPHLIARQIASRAFFRTVNANFVAVVLAGWAGPDAGLSIKDVGILAAKTRIGPSAGATGEGAWFAFHG